MYLVQWGDSKEKAWSGTNWHLYKALQNYLELVDIDIPITPTPSFFQQLFNLKSDQPDVGLRVTKQGGSMLRHFFPRGIISHYSNLQKMYLIKRTLEHIFIKI